MRLFYIYAFLFITCSVFSQGVHHDLKIAKQTTAQRPAQTQWAYCLLDTIYSYGLTDSGLTVQNRNIYTYDNNRNRTNKLYQVRQSNNSWSSTQQWLYTYDANSNLITETAQSYSFGLNPWVNTTKSIYVYDAANRITSLCSQVWSGGSWLNSRLDSVVYDSNNEITVYLIQTWNPQSNAWGDNFKETYTFDASDHLLTDLSQNWSAASSTWSTITLSTYSYSSSGSLESELIQVTNSNTNSALLSYTFAPPVTQRVAQQWQNSSWQNTGRLSYTTNVNTADTLRQVWNTATNAWQNDAQSSQNSNNSGQPIIQLYATWNSTTNVWENQYKYIYYYNNFGNTTSITAQGWASTNVWVSVQTDVYYYDCTGVYQGLSSQQKEDDGIRVYPNPAASYLTIKAPGTVSKVTISDISGRTVRSGEASEAIDISDLQDGVYLLQLFNEQGLALKASRFLKAGQ